MSFFHEPRTDAFYSYTLKNKKTYCQLKTNLKVVIYVIFSENIVL